MLICFMFVSELRWCCRGDESDEIGAIGCPKHERGRFTLGPLCHGPINHGIKTPFSLYSNINDIQVSMYSTLISHRRTRVRCTPVPHAKSRAAHLGAERAGGTRRWRSPQITQCRLPTFRARALSTDRTRRDFLPILSSCGTSSRNLIWTRAHARAYHVRWRMVERPSCFMDLHSRVVGQIRPPNYKSVFCIE